jgi:glucose/arabinose dehydrogenase
MTAGRDPRGSPPAAYRAGPPSSGGPFSGPNLPFTLIIVVCVAALVWFLVLVQPFSDGGIGGPALTTVPDGDATTTTEPDGGTPVAPTVPPDTPPLQGIRLEVITHDVQFPVYATGLEGDDRIFVLERAGRVRAIAPDGTASTFLDLTDRVDSAGIENGLLGMAFHPDYAVNGRIFIYYTAPSQVECASGVETGRCPDSRLSEFRSSGAGATSADPATERVLIHWEQRGERHRGGMITFGPDGYLWLSMGDGGMGDRASQDLDTLPGSILRIDVDADQIPYGIPPDNPFVAGGGRPEIWAYGLRNPWRFSIDPVDGLIFIGDVGQETREEINAAPLDAPALNYGWPDFEGTHCYRPPEGNCNVDPGVPPILEYGTNAPGGGCAVTGGFVYRGSRIPELWGHYFYADWCQGWLRSFRYVDGQVTDERDWSDDLQASFDQIPEVNYILISSLGLDADGELLVVDSDGVVFRMVAHR